MKKKKNGRKNPPKKLSLISIIIPVYNEELFLKQVIKKVLNADTYGLKKEIILVDDGSTDRSRKILSSFRKKNQFTILHKKNEGKGSALKKGILASRGNIVLIQDADLEYSPDDYPVLLEPFFLKNADVVYGSRFISDRPHRVLYFWHSLGNKLLTLLSNMFTNINITDMETGYKVFKGPLIRSIAKQLVSKRFGFEPEITARIAKIPDVQIYEVGISYHGRTYEQGKKIVWQDGIRAVFEICFFNIFVKSPKSHKPAKK